MIYKKGVSGIMRVKNDAEFIAACIESCIDALDELIVVYNDCTDNSVAEIDNMRKRYPDKIRVYEYPHKVLGVGLTKEEYAIAKSLPEDSPALLCNYYNFALSKVRYEYAIKIDADQMYFTDKLKMWCDVVRQKVVLSGNFGLGMLFHYYFLIYRYVCLKLRLRFPIMPNWIIDSFKSHYLHYAVKQTLCGKACLSFSGVNVFKDERWCVSLGLKNDNINILPPFNGEADHLLFKVSDKTYYRKFDMDYYNLISNSSFSLIEEFIHPYKPMFVGFCWFHMNAMRNRLKRSVLEVKRTNNDAFVSIDQFVDLNYKSIERCSDKRIFTLYQRVLFSYIYRADRKSIKDNLNFLNTL